jgi:hypothetical protein
LLWRSPRRGPPSISISSREDRSKLEEAAAFLRQYEDRLVIEHLLAAAPERTRASFYRTSAGAEIDLVLEVPGQRSPWAIEIKRGLAVRPRKGFHYALEDIAPARGLVCYPGDDRYAISEEIEVIGVRALAEEIAATAR